MNPSQTRRIQLLPIGPSISYLANENETRLAVAAYFWKHPVWPLRNH